MTALDFAGAFDKVNGQPQPLSLQTLRLRYPIPILLLGKIFSLRRLSTSTDQGEKIKQWYDRIGLATGFGLV